MSATERIYARLEARGPLTQHTLRRELELSESTVVNCLLGLSRTGRIERVGKEPTIRGRNPLTVWAVVPEPPSNVIESALQSRTALEVAWR